MSKYLLKIKLISDLCVSDGGVYNSAIDTDICYDKNGIPYIPAKRIKGCLRESALELKDWGLEIPINKIFGDKGECRNRGNVSISNAYISNYENYTKEIENNKGNRLYHAQKILDLFSYTRTQTGIDNETGVADDNSLRTIRVANRGLEFIAKVQVNEEYEQLLKKCIDNFTNMGIARTRGLGEICADLIKVNDEKKGSEKTKIEYSNGANYIAYKIILKEPMVTLSTVGNQEIAKDYIEGSSIGGLLLSRANPDQREKLLETGICFSNAYIAKDGKRLKEVPAYYSSIKNNKKNYINNLYYKTGSDKTIQVNAMKHCYVTIDGNDLIKADVEMEERYHHRRSDDKSIGRAESTNTSDSAFYQMASIDGGQEFRGYIIGSSDQIKVCYELLKEEAECRMGYGRTSEYGEATIEVTEIKHALSNKKIVNTKRIVATLNSPTIVYGINASYSVSVNDLIDEVLATFEITDKKELIDDNLTRKYVKYILLGGYNVTWNRRKPVITAFDKGTSIDIHFKEEVELIIPEIMFLGERTREGYGECEFFIPVEEGQSQGNIKKYDTETIGESVQIDLEKCNLGKMLATKDFIDYMNIRAIEEASKFEIKEVTRAVISNMLLMCSEQTNLKGVKNAVEKRFDKKVAGKPDKYEIAMSILEVVDKDFNKEGEQQKSSILDDYCQETGLTNFAVKDMELEFLQLFLRTVKYKIRTKKGKQ